MSAFIVSRHHIHQLVTALDTTVAPTEAPTALGQLLWDENIASVSYRYNDEPVSDLPGPIGETYLYEYVTPQRTLTPVEIHTMTRGYRYQSCEHPDWESSEACRLTEMLLTTIETQLGKTAAQIRDSQEGQKAGWSIDDDEPRTPPVPVNTTPPRRINLVDTAKLVRKALKEAYPTVKFSVRCDRYSMGQSIDVLYVDGPVQSEVQALLNQFDHKSFDGMDDSTHYHTQEYQGETVTFGADYVTASRSISPTFMRQIACKVAAQYKVAVPAVGGETHGEILPTPESLVRVQDAPPFHREECLRDVIYHVAYHTSALPKPRIRLMPTVREVVA
jgi:hypothetical protein